MFDNRTNHLAQKNISHLCDAITSIRKLFWKGFNFSISGKKEG